ncbi:hypothetical protein DL98DRAFT_538692 [Cadophora sp. DSE1049]|nr:hypothetical protein DL98DRAFT_538692 [Cadophora sp. DSE1049]
MTSHISIVNFDTRYCESGISDRNMQLPASGKGFKILNMQKLALNAQLKAAVSKVRQRALHTAKPEVEDLDSRGCESRTLGSKADKILKFYAYLFLVELESCVDFTYMPSAHFRPAALNFELAELCLCLKELLTSTGTSELIKTHILRHASSNIQVQYHYAIQVTVNYTHSWMQQSKKYPIPIKLKCKLPMISTATPQPAAQDRCLGRTR